MKALWVLRSGSGRYTRRWYKTRDPPPPPRRHAGDKLAGAAAHQGAADQQKKQEDEGGAGEVEELGRKAAKVGEEENTVVRHISAIFQTRA